jgi:hypothetical protein
MRATCLWHDACVSGVTHTSSHAINHTSTYQCVAWRWKVALLCLLRLSSGNTIAANEHCSRVLWSHGNRNSCFWPESGSSALLPASHLQFIRLGFIESGWAGQRGGCLSTPPPVRACRHAACLLSAISNVACCVYEQNAIKHVR